MKFHLMQPGTVGRRSEIEQGLAGQRSDLYLRYLDEIKGYVRMADDLGFYGYGHNEHHLQVEGFEESNHPGMMSLFVGLHSTRLTVGTLGYVLPTHNPVRVAEEIATLDHMLNGRLLVGFVRGFQARWVDSYRGVPAARATTPQLVKARDDQDTTNREIFAESLEVVRKAWTNPAFSHHGTYWHFPPEGGSEGHPAYELYGHGLGDDGRVHEIGIAPLPLQRPHPPLYGAFAHSMRTSQLWARHGGKLIVMASNLDFCEMLTEKYRETAGASGREVSRSEAAAWGGALLLGRDEGHVKELVERWNWMWDAWFVPYGQQYPNLIAGTAEQVTEYIEQARARLDFNECWLQFGQGLFEPEENGEMLHDFATKVMPEFSTPNDRGVYV